MRSVWVVWSDEDYYGPDLVEIHGSREGAEAAKDLLNEPYRTACRRHGFKIDELDPNWPHRVEDYEVEE